MNSPKLPLAVPAPAPRDTAQRWAALFPGQGPTQTQVTPGSSISSHA